jgi:protein-S-isoprenylcysteine O-methyltransferase Ste14
MQFLELKVPTPFLLLLTIVAMLGLWWLHACPLSNQWGLPLAILLGVTGLTVMFASMLRFWQMGTTITPFHPEKATRLVVTGMYRYSRNPMYVGVTLVLLAFGIFLDDGLALLVVPLFPMYVNYFQIVPEERILERLFGDEYREYKKRVRRWL